MPTLEEISVVLTFGGTVAGFYLLYWQVRIGPRDRQEWAALLFVGSVSLILALLCWRYLGGPMVGGTLQGVAAFFFVMVSLIWLAIQTRAMNAAILRQRRNRAARDRKQ